MHIFLFFQKGVKAICKQKKNKKPLNKKFMQWKQGEINQLSAKIKHQTLRFVAATRKQGA